MILGRGLSELTKMEIEEIIEQKGLFNLLVLYWEFLATKVGQLIIKDGVQTGQIEIYNKLCDLNLQF